MSLVQLDTHALDPKTAMPFPEAAKADLRDTQLRRNVARATDTIQRKRAALVEEKTDWQALRDASANYASAPKPDMVAIMAEWSRQDPVIILGQSLGVFVYVRNLMLVKKNRLRAEKARRREEQAIQKSPVLADLPPCPVCMKAASRCRAVP